MINFYSTFCEVTVRLYYTCVDKRSENMVICFFMVMKTDVHAKQ